MGDWRPPYLGLEEAMTHAQTLKHTHTHTDKHFLLPTNVFYVIIIYNMRDIWHRRMWGVKSQDSFLHPDSQALMKVRKM